MYIICLTPLTEGVYNDNFNPLITTPPEGWAMIPEDMELPSTFPRLGSLEAENIDYPYEVVVEKKDEETGEIVKVTEQRVRTIMTVTKMTEGTLPEPKEEPEQEADAEPVSWEAMAAAIEEGVNSI